MEFLKDLWLFLKERKKIWLAPVILILLILGLLISSLTMLGIFLFWNEFFLTFKFFIEKTNARFLL